MNNNWHLTTGSQVAMWIIVLLVSLLLFLGGRETAGHKVRDNKEGINILTVRVDKHDEEFSEPTMHDI